MIRRRCWRLLPWPCSSSRSGSTLSLLPSFAVVAATAIVAAMSAIDAQRAIIVEGLLRSWPDLGYPQRRYPNNKQSRRFRLDPTLLRAIAAHIDQHQLTPDSLLFPTPWSPSRPDNWHVAGPAQQRQHSCAPTPAPQPPPTLPAGVKYATATVAHCETVPLPAASSPNSTPAADPCT